MLDEIYAIIIYLKPSQGNSMSTPSFTMPAGRYFVGDLCYVMHPQWDEFCTKSLANEGLVVLDNGVRTAQFGTMYGDGCYQDQSGNAYGVDSGLIGCILVQDISDDTAYMEGGNIIEFPKDFECSDDDDGVMHFGHIKINTGDDEPDETNYEDDPEDEENQE